MGWSVRKKTRQAGKARGFLSKGGILGEARYSPDRQHTHFAFFLPLQFSESEGLKFSRRGKEEKIAIVGGKRGFPKREGRKLAKQYRTLYKHIGKKGVGAHGEVKIALEGLLIPRSGTQPPLLSPSNGADKSLSHIEFPFLTCVRLLTTDDDELCVSGVGGRDVTMCTSPLASAAVCSSSSSFPGDGGAADSCTAASPPPPLPKSSPVSLYSAPSSAPVKVDLSS